MMSSKSEKYTKKNKKTVYSVDIREFDELKEAIFEYFLLMTEILNKEDFEIQKIELDINSEQIIVSGETVEPPEEEKSTEDDDDYEWI